LDEGEDFARAKGNLMKFRGIEIVDKSLDCSIADHQESKAPLIWSSDLAYASLAAINSANSLDDLAISVIVDEAGNNRGPLKSIADRIRIILDEKEREFQTLMASLIKALRSEERGRRTAQRNHSVIKSGVIDGEAPFPDALDLDYASADDDRKLACTYVYWAYILLQAIGLEKTGVDTCGINDFEDGQLCAYVPLDEPLWVVSGDKQLRERLAETRELLIAVGLSERARFQPATPDLLLPGGQS
jgi:hypothetical protein